MKYLLLFVLLICVYAGYSQVKPGNESKSDSLLNKILLRLPKEIRGDFLKEYKTLSIEQRKKSLEFLDVMTSLPKSSKKQLKENIDSNYANISALKSFFKKLVSDEYTYSIEFKPPQKALQLEESIDIKVFRKRNGISLNETICQEWNVELKSSKLDSLLKLTFLTRGDLSKLKVMLDMANCISVNNAGASEIGFARSGMGKYSYLIFDNPLTEKEIKSYNNGCEYIYYKRNIVLMYGGGAVGPQCFPDPL
jgi:hypothetical protein